MTEKEKMIAGELYDPNDPELVEGRATAQRLCNAFNALTEGDPARTELLAQLCPNCHPSVLLRGPIYMDYGTNFYMGENSYANWNFCVMDVCPIHIGARVLIGPNVTLAAPLHPMDSQQRAIFYDETKEYWTDREYGKPITIGDDCWLGAGVIVLPGVNIGNRCVIGAGSVVTHDIPDNSVAVGNPCRVIRKTK